MSNRTSSRGYGIAAAASAAWAATSPGIRFLLDRNVPSLTIALWRDIAICAFLVVVLAIVNRKLLRVNTGDLRGLGFTGFLSIGIYHALWVWSVLLNGAAVAVVLIYLYPAFVTLGMALIYKERITPLQMVSLVLSLIGCALVVRAYDADVFRLNALGLVVGLLTAITHTVYVLFNQKRVKSLNSWTSLMYTMGFGAITLFVMTLLIAPHELPPPADPISFLVLIALGIGPTLGGYGLFTLSLRYIPARIASLIVVMEVPIATLIAVFFLSERLEWPMVIGMVLVLLAAVLPTVGAELINRRAGAAQPAMAMPNE
jgi:drug/metabolite transporter (DMT)-like permease